MSVRCAGCMKLFDKKYDTCPHCGYSVGNEYLITDQIKPGTLLQDRYYIGKSLGNGGFGITYVAWDNKLEQKVAIKEYFPRDFSARSSAGTDVVAFSGEKEQSYHKGLNKFIEEARMLARFSDNNGIVSVRDYFEENNTAYIVMEFIEGKTLNELINHKGKLTDIQTLALVTPIMKALNEIHKAGIIHRDISPDNIMINNRQIMLLDFGAARIASGSSSNMSIVLKHGYAPEEQYRTKGVQGPWTDIYSLCATMYRCITGIIPDESFERVMNDTLQSPSALGIQINPVIESVIMKGLNVRAEDRFQSINEVFLELKKINNSAEALDIEQATTSDSNRSTDSDSNRLTYDESTQNTDSGLISEGRIPAVSPDEIFSLRKLLTPKNIAIIILIVLTLVFSMVLVIRNKNRLNHNISLITTTSTTTTEESGTEHDEDYEFNFEMLTEPKSSSETTSETTTSSAASSTSASTTESTASTSKPTSTTEKTEPKTSKTTKTKKTEKTSTSKTTTTTTEKTTENTADEPSSAADEPTDTTEE